MFGVKIEQVKIKNPGPPLLPFLKKIIFMYNYRTFKNVLCLRKSLFMNTFVNKGFRKPLETYRMTALSAYFIHTGIAEEIFFSEIITVRNINYFYCQI